MVEISSSAARSAAVAVYYCCTCSLVTKVNLISDPTDVSIVLSSSDGNVTVHSTVLLVCVACGKSTPDITWQFNGSLIQANTSTRVNSTCTTYLSTLCSHI